MFKIDFSLFICYYLCGQIFIFLLLWLTDRAKPIKQRPLSSDRIWQCSICLHVYFEAKASKISTCPLCGSFNQKQTIK